MHCNAGRAPAPGLTLEAKKISFARVDGGRSSAWLEPQIVDLDVAGSNPVGHPNEYATLPPVWTSRLRVCRGLLQTRFKSRPITGFDGKIRPTIANSRGANNRPPLET